MGIRGKILSLVIVGLIFSFTVEAIILQAVYLNSFTQQEQGNSVKDIQRAEGIIDDQINNIKIKIADWAVWDDSYNFVLKPNQEFVDSNLGSNSLTAINISYMIFISSQSGVVNATGADLNTGEKVQVPEELIDYAIQEKSLTTFKNEKDIKYGIIEVNDHNIGFASAPIVKSNGEGPIAGTIIFARLLDDNFFKQISILNQSTLSFYDYDGPSLPRDIIDIKTKMPNGLRYKEPDGEEDLYVVENESNLKLAIYTTVYDYNDKPVFILKDELPRSFYILATNSIHFTLIVFVIISGASLILAYLLLNKIVISRITKLNKDVGEVTDPKNIKNRLDFSGNDEFASLASNINQMLNVISRSEKDLEKFKFVIEGATDHIIITDPDGKILFANKSAEKLTGYTRQEMMGKTPALWGKQMPREFYEKLWDTIKNKKETFTGEVTNKNRDGKLYPVQAIISPILDEYRNVIYFVGIERDISADKKLAHQLQNEKLIVEQEVRQRTKELYTAQIQLQASISSLALGFILTDNQNSIVLINQAARNLLCSSPDSPLKTVLNCTLNHIEDELNGAIDLRNKIGETIQNKKPTTIDEVPFQGRILKIYINPIMELAEVIGTVVLIDDITERKIVERSKDEFFSIASHELRTPLTAIRGNTSIIKDYYSDEIKNPEIKSMIDDIKESSERLIQIVNDFLDTSRLELGKIVFKKESIDIKELVESVINEFGVSGSKKKLYLRFDPPKDVLIPNVIGDKDRARQILVNLIGNALKYSDEGGITVSLDKEGGFIKVLVTDTGKGISPENQKLLFRKFQQAGNNIFTRESSQSTGLGLYIARLMAEGMGGEVKLEKSEVGVGSTFSFALQIDKDWMTKKPENKD